MKFCFSLFCRLCFLLMVLFGIICGITFDGTSVRGGLAADACIHPDYTPSKYYLPDYLDYPWREQQGLTVKFSQDGKKIVSCDGSSIKVWNAQSAKKIKEFREDYRIGSFAVSPSGKNIAYTTPNSKNCNWWEYSGENYIRLTIRNLESGELIRRFHYPPNEPIGDDVDLLYPAQILEDIAFSPDGKLIAGCINSDFPYLDNAIFSWKLEDGRQVRIEKKRDGTVVVLDARTKRPLRQFKNLKGKVIIWDPETGGLIREIMCNSKEVRSVAFSPDSKMIAVSGQRDIEDHYGTVEAWELSSGKKIFKIYEKESEPFSLRGFIVSPCFSPDNSQLFGFYRTMWHTCRYAPVEPDPTEEAIISWNIRTGKERFRIKPEVKRRECVLYDNKSQTVNFSVKDFNRDLCIAFLSIDIYQFLQEPGACKHILFSPSRTWFPDAISLSPDGKTLAISASSGINSRIFLFNAQTGGFIKQIEPHNVRITSLDFSPDCHRIAAGMTDRSVRIYNVHENVMVLPQPIFHEAAYSLSPKFKDYYRDWFYFSSFPKNDLMKPKIKNPPF